MNIFWPFFSKCSPSNVHLCTCDAFMSLLSRELTDCPPRRGLYRMTTAAQTLHRYTLSSLHALRWLRHSVVAVCLWIWSTALYLAKHKGTKLEHIQRDIKQLKKLPVHLALLVNEREVSCSDLARLVNWCFCVGIHYVSLYDPRGRLHIHSTGCGFKFIHS